MKIPIIPELDTSIARCLFDEAPIGMAVVSPGNRLLRVNRALCGFLGYSEAELTGKSISAITHPDDREASRSAIRRMRTRGFPIQRIEKRYLHKSGRAVWGEVTASPVVDDAGRLRFTIAQVIGVDAGLAARKLAEEALRESEDRLSRILELSPMSMAIVSMDGVIEYINRKSIETFGYLPEEIPTMERWWALAYPDETYRREVVADWMGRVEKAVVGKHDIKGGEYRATCKDGSVKTVFIFGVPVANKVFVMFDDITERKRAEEALQAAHDELEEKVRDRTAKLRSLAGKMAAVEHGERRRIAHVLHEDLQQLLAAIKFQVSGLQKQGAKARSGNTPDRALQLLDQAIEVTRTLCVDLRPPVLYELGLMPALDWLADDMKEKFGLSVKVSGSAAVDKASDETRVFVFEAVRELLLNVVKHAGVKSVHVRVRRPAAGTVKVEVKDRGVGFAPAEHAERTFGLFSIRERAQLLGGQFEIVSAPGKGTFAALTLPAGSGAQP